jgi:hypothetical protein
MAFRIAEFPGLDIKAKALKGSRQRFGIFYRIYRVLFTDLPPPFF